MDPNDNRLSASEFKEIIIEHLNKAKEYANQSIEEHSELEINEKENLGLLIKDCTLVNEDQSIHLFNIVENLSKIRTGDPVYLMSESDVKLCAEGEVVDITNNSISVKTNKILEKKTDYIIELKEIELYDNFIKTLENESDENIGGTQFLELLLGNGKSEPGKFLPLTKLNRFSFEGHEPLQAKAIQEVCKRPSLYVIQGPPGTGKTRVLADIAGNYSNRNFQVAVVANTHFAVNNALNYIKKLYPNHNVIKIGKEIKTEGLRNDILKFSTLHEYLQWNKNNKNRPTGNIVGMTLQASTINLGLIHSSFKPSLLLVDEASQIPLAEGAVLGFYRANTIVFLGDDKQMSPIFQPELINHPLSTSIFSRVKDICGDNFTTLTTTFRMNEEITEFVSRQFYEPSGIRLTSHESCSRNKIDEKPSIEEILTLNNDSRDYNLEEAQNAIDCIKEIIQKDLSVAVLTPFRRQVNVIRQMLKEQVDEKNQKRCIIDTVERLQGKDVDVVIMSFCVSDPDYYKEIKSFVENPNRLNVMYSRAKKKVFILKSNLINNVIDHNK